MYGMFTNAVITGLFDNPITNSFIIKPIKPGKLWLTYLKYLTVRF